MTPSPKSLSLPEMTPNELETAHVAGRTSPRVGHLRNSTERVPDEEPKRKTTPVAVLCIYLEFPQRKKQTQEKGCATFQRFRIAKFYMVAQSWHFVRIHEFHVSRVNELLRHWALSALDHPALG